MSRLRRRLLLVGDERGAIMIIVGICLVMIMAVAALTIDLGMLQATRAETQRAADAAALAGASEYQFPAPTAEGAEARARDWASRNFIRGNAADAGELDITVNHAAQRVTVRIQQPHDTWFARILGINSANVGAIAAARVINSGTAGCIKPFAIPDGTYDDDDVFTKVLLWESFPPGQGQNADDAVGYTKFILVGNTQSPAGVGRDIYHMITDTSCEFSNIEVGDEIPAQPSNNTRGNVNSADNDLNTLYGELTWTEDGPYDGFNIPDYISHPRVSLIPTYDESTYNPPGTTNVTVTGFLAVAFLSGYETCNNNAANTPNCHNPESNGNQRQYYAVLLPAFGVSDGCAGVACSTLNRALQLVE